MKKFMTLVTSLILVLSMAACGTQEKAPEIGGQVQIPNPFVTCENLNDAAAIAGFEMTLPAKLPNWVADTEIRAVENQMIEIIYSGTKNQELRVRKANGQEDISGRYDSFENVEEITVNDRTMTMKGNGDQVNVAIWTDGEHAFSVVSEEGMDQTHLEEMISGIR